MYQAWTNTVSFFIYRDNYSPQKAKKSVQTFSKYFPQYQCSGQVSNKKMENYYSCIQLQVLLKAVYELCNREREDLFLMLQILLKQWLETCRKSTCDSLLWNTCYLRWDFNAQRVALSSDINFFETRNKIVYRICISLFKVLSRIYVVGTVGTEIKTQPFLLQGA